jgi:hypothetical protein
MLVMSGGKAGRIYGLYVLYVYIMPRMVIVGGLKKQRLCLGLELRRSYSCISK